jgi:hypothetical protein
MHSTPTYDTSDSYLYSTSSGEPVSLPPQLRKPETNWYDGIINALNPNKADVLARLQANNPAFKGDYYTAGQPSGPWDTGEWGPKSRQPSGPWDTGEWGPKPKGEDPIVIDENRILGRIQESVPNSQNWFERMMGGAKDKFSNFKMPPLGIMGLINAIGNQFEDRQLTGDIMDESGNMYSAEALNKMNAKGGYYTDPARSARRRTNRIRNMLNRQKAGKKISTTNLQTLQKQADDQNIHNIQQYTGKPVSQYRMDRPASERQFTGHGRSGMGRDPSDKMARGGRVGYADGGLATLFTRRG